MRKLTPQQVEHVQRSWRAVLPVGDTFAELLYGKLFSLDPRLRVLFKSDLREQGRNLTAMMSVAAGAIGQPERIALAVRQLGKRHLAYGVRHEHFAAFGVALVWALEKSLGESFTPEAKEAWEAAFALLLALMRDGPG